MAKVEGRTKREAININNISYLLASLVLAGILGLSAIPVRAYEGLVPEEINHTDMDPTDDVHGGQTGLRELESATDPLLSSWTRGDEVWTARTIKR